MTPKNFGRIAAVAGKQIIVQRLREAERNLVYTQYADKEGQIVVGVVQKMINLVLLLILVELKL